MKIILLFRYWYHRCLHFFKQHELVSSIIGIVFLFGIALLIYNILNPGKIIIYPHAKIVATKTDFRSQDQIHFTLKLGEQLPKKYISMVPKAYAAQDAKVFPAKAIIATGTMNTPMQVEEHVTGSNTIAFTVQHADSGFRSGEYHLQVTLQKDGQSRMIEQDFSLGVLAVNTDKSIYTPGETAYLQMAVLTQYGHTECGANVQLSIKSPSGKVSTFKTTDKTITNSKTCGPDNVTDTPDYFTHMQVNEIGTYMMTLTNETDSHSITDTFNVHTTVPFVISRIAATRVNPYKSTYTMHVSVTANQDFTGEVDEPVPDSFIIQDANIQTKTRDQNTKILYWNISLKKGEIKELDYTYQSPRISPEFYTVGPLSLDTTTTTIPKETFSETRQWQIASDGSCTSKAVTANWSTTSDWNTGCTGTGGIPGTGDSVTIANGAVITYSTNTALSLNSLTINSGCTLSFGTSTATFTLTGTTGPVLSNSGTYTHGSETILINGNATMTPISGTLTVNNLTFSPAQTSTGKTYTLSSGLGVSNNFTIQPITGTFLLTVTMGDNLTVGGTLSLTRSNSATTVLNTVSGTNYAITAGKIAVAAGATLTTNASTLTFTGSSSTLFTNAGTITSLTSTNLVFQPTASVTLTNFALGTMHSFTYNASGFTGTMGGTMTDAGALTVSAGTLNVSTFAVTGTAGQTFNVASGAKYTTAVATSPLPTAYNGADFSLDPNSTIEIATAGTVTLQINGANAAAINFGNIILDPAGTRTYTWPAGTPSIAGNLTMGGGGGTLTVNATTNDPTLTIPGNFTITGTTTFIASNVNNLTIGGNFTNGSTFTNGGASTATIFTSTTTGNTITCNSQSFNNLTFNSSSGGWTFQDACEISKTFTITAGTVTTSSSTLTADGNFNTSGGTLIATVGTIDFTSGATITGTQTLNNVAMDGCAVGYTIAAGTTLTTNGTLTFDQNCNNGSAFLDGTGGITALGNVSVADEGTGQTSSGTPAIITISGTGNQTLSGDGNVNDNYITSIVINKPSGTLTISNSLAVSGNWTYIQGTVSATGSTISFVNLQNTTYTISGTLTLNNVAIAGDPNPGGYTIAAGTQLTAAGNFVFDSNNTNMVVNGGTNSLIIIQGNFTTADSGMLGNIPISFTGGNNQTLTLNATLNGSVYEPTGNVTINKSGGTVTLATTWRLANTGQTLTISGGTLDLAGHALTVNSTLTLNGTGGLKLQGAEVSKAQSLAGFGSGTTVNYTGSGTYATLDLGTNYGNLTFSGTGTWTDASSSAVLNSYTQSAGTVNFSSGNLTIGGNFAHTGGSFNPSNTVIFNDATQPSVITGSTTFNNLTSTTHAKIITLPASTTQTVSGALTLTGAIHGLITLQSSSPGTQATLNVNGSQSITGVAAQDINSCGGSVTPLNDSLPGDSGNNSCWSFANYLNQAGELMNVYGGTKIQGGTTLKSN